jgi:hypothetical protein
MVNGGSSDSNFTRRKKRTVSEAGAENIANGPFTVRVAGLRRRGWATVSPKQAKGWICFRLAFRG